MTEQAIRDFVEKKSEQEDRSIRNYDIFLRKVVLYCRTLNPKVDQEARSILNESFIRISFKVKQNNLPFGSNRIRDTLFRITRAIAKLKLKKVADKSDAKDAIEFYNSMVQQTIGVITIPDSAQDVAVRTMLDILKKDAKMSDMSLKESGRESLCTEPTSRELSAWKSFRHWCKQQVKRDYKHSSNHSSVIKRRKREASNPEMDRQDTSVSTITTNNNNSR